MNILGDDSTRNLHRIIASCLITRVRVRLSGLMACRLVGRRNLLHSAVDFHHTFRLSQRRISLRAGKSHFTMRDESKPADYSSWTAAELIQRVTELENKLKEQNSK